jgi:hypothetical protein
MATFQDIQNNVTWLLKRGTFYDAQGNDVTSQALSLFVNNALMTLQRRIVVKSAQEVSATITVGPANHPFPLTSLPYPYRYGYDLWVVSPSPTPAIAGPLYRYKTVRDYHKDYPPSTAGASSVTGAPISYVLYDGSLYLGPPPNQNYTLVWDYIQWLPALVNPTDTNWFTLNAADALTYYACKEAAIWLQEDQLIQFYHQIATEKLQEVLRTFREEEVAEGDLIVELYG